MARRGSRMPALGSAMPDTALIDGDGRRHALVSRDQGRPLLVAFICNHCPYVVHILPSFAERANDWRRRGVEVIAISANDPMAYPADAPQRMAALAAELKFAFPYLHDATQEVALAYGAVCTPDFFLYDRAGRLAYRGQYDASRPGNGVPVTGGDLDAACVAVLAGNLPAADQAPSLGCSIKWRADRAPDWA